MCIYVYVYVYVECITEAMMGDCKRQYLGVTRPTSRVSVFK